MGARWIGGWVLGSGPSYENFNVYNFYYFVSSTQKWCHFKYFSGYQQGIFSV